LEAALDPLFEQFTQEQKYLKNVSPATIEWYKQSLKWLGNPKPDEAALKDMVMRMRAKGRKPTGCNCCIRAVNAYLHWASGVAGKCCALCTHLKVPKLKEEHRILPTFSIEDVKKITKWKPKGFHSTRLHVFMLTLIDTGCRSGEALGVRWADVDLDNLLLKLQGKGAKDRLVPFSFELRRHLYRWKKQNRWDLVFPSHQGQYLGRRDQLRDVKRLCKRLGIVPPARTIHALRHTFAVNYLRRGGSVFHLQKVLGHSSLEMTRRYANLVTEDLQAVHERVSLLSIRV
jgi:integrase/recombinase XerD